MLDVTDEELLDFVNGLPKGDRRKSLALDPVKIKKLLEKGTVKVAKLFHIAEDLLMLKRYHLCN